MASSARRERQTLVPEFDPAVLAKELESGVHPTAPPPFDPIAYARIVDAHASISVAGAPAPANETVAERDPDSEIETMARAMYSSYLAGDFHEAIALAERLRASHPEHALAEAVITGCREMLGWSANARISPSSIVRLKSTRAELATLRLDATSSFVLGHVDGISDAATIAALSGIPRAEALDSLHALLALDVVELVG